MRIAIGPPQANSRADDACVAADSTPTADATADVTRRRPNAPSAAAAKFAYKSASAAIRRPGRNRLVLGSVAGTLAVSAALAAAAAVPDESPDATMNRVRSHPADTARAGRVRWRAGAGRRAPSRSICCWCSPPTCRAASIIRSSCCSARATPRRSRTRRCSTPSAPARTARSRSTSSNGRATARRRS